MVESSKRKVDTGDTVPCGFLGGGVVCSFVCFVFWGDNPLSLLPHTMDEQFFAVLLSWYSSRPLAAVDWSHAPGLTWSPYRSVTSGVWQWQQISTISSVPRLEPWLGSCWALPKAFAGLWERGEDVGPTLPWGSGLHPRAHMGEGRN